MSIKWFMQKATFLPLAVLLGELDWLRVHIGTVDKVVVDAGQIFTRIRKRQRINLQRSQTVTAAVNIH